MIFGCRANADGGAAWISNGSAVTFRDCEFLGNVAAGAFGEHPFAGGEQGARSDQPRDSGTDDDDVRLMAPWR